MSIPASGGSVESFSENSLQESRVPDNERGRRILEKIANVQRECGVTAVQRVETKSLLCQPGHYAVLSFDEAMRFFAGQNLVVRGSTVFTEKTPGGWTSHYAVPTHIMVLSPFSDKDFLNLAGVSGMIAPDGSPPGGPAWTVPWFNVCRMTTVFSRTLLGMKCPQLSQAIGGSQSIALITDCLEKAVFSGPHPEVIDSWKTVPRVFVPREVL